LQQAQPSAGTSPELDRARRKRKSEEKSKKVAHFSAPD
jgi:hypothetical protein